MIRECLLIENPYNEEFSDHIGFMDMSIGERTVTGDRKEFFGSGGIASPDVLKRESAFGSASWDRFGPLRRHASRYYPYTRGKRRCHFPLGDVPAGINRGGYHKKVYRGLGSERGTG